MTVFFDLLQINVRTRKVWRDLWENPTRTIIVVLAIAVGVFALGVTAGTQVVLSDEVRGAYFNANPADATVYLGDPFYDDMLRTLAREEALQHVEGLRRVGARLNVGPNRWRNIRIDIHRDFDQITISEIFTIAGAWPPPPDTILLERASFELAGVQIGDAVTIETTDGETHALTVAGSLYDPHKMPTPLNGLIYGYVTAETFERMGFDDFYHLLRVSLVESRADDVDTVLSELENSIRKNNNRVIWSYVPPPGEFPGDQSLQPILSVLNLVGIFLLIVSSFLVVNTISGILVKHIQQIGIMKTIGAHLRHLLVPYLGTVFAYGILALIIGVPLGAMGAHYFSVVLADLMNVEITTFRVAPSAVRLQVVAGLLTPLIAALWPVLSGVRITVREAIGGQSEMYSGRTWVDRWLERIRGISAQILFALRNTFRRKARLLITLGALSMAGALFVAIFNLRTALQLTLVEFSTFWRYDVEVEFVDPQNLTRVRDEAQLLPLAYGAEGWGQGRAVIIDDDGDRIGNFF